MSNRKLRAGDLVKPVARSIFGWTEHSVSGIAMTKAISGDKLGLVVKYFITGRFAVHFRVHAKFLSVLVDNEIVFFEPGKWKRVREKSF
jgi:hypothetical protein